MDVTVEHNVPATMRDGTILRADVYRPATGGPYPVLLSRLPYGKNYTVNTSHLDLLAVAKSGFIVVIQDTRGRAASDGEWQTWTHEPGDGYDTVRWAASLPDSNGNVGMIGVSYYGNTQWTAALAGPPELKAIAPQTTWSDPHDGLFSRGGAMEFALNMSWTLMMGVDTLTRRHADDPAGLGKALGALVADMDRLDTDVYWELPAGNPPAYQRHGLHNQDLGFEHALRDPEWSAVNRVAGRHAEIDLPSLNLGGWYDVFSQGTLDNFIQARAEGRPTNLIMGPWTHETFTGQIGDLNFGTGAGVDVLGFRGRFVDIQNAWFRRWLTPGAATSGSELPPVLLFVQGKNEWREEQEWPLSRAVDTDLFLRADQQLAFEAPKDGEGSDAYVYDPADPVPTTGGALITATGYRAGPLDQAPVEAREDVLVYTSEPLTEDLEVTGRVRAFLHAATDAPSTDWVVRLCDVDEKGVSRNVVDGILRADTTPGEFAEHAVDLWSTSYLFRAGHRLRVHVTSSSFPRWDRNLNTGEPVETATDFRPARQDIAHDAARPSRIVLPVVPATN
ncbi:CocE/NonD family hydrolase [Streptomyces pseudovenezuelae]|uniref:CocE/NonD family hydrolase n=1 Tax=Streptomyces pseudovenezuelae TaxID=67350 RepID=UPI002E30BB44|nr:CocE/NonD family hydrolase [Streptomyces pseudovenezuelae]